MAHMLVGWIPESRWPCWHSQTQPELLCGSVDLSYKGTENTSLSDLGEKEENTQWLYCLAQLKILKLGPISPDIGICGCVSSRFGLTLSLSSASPQCDPPFSGFLWWPYGSRSPVTLVNPAKKRGNLSHNISLPYRDLGFILIGSTCTSSPYRCSDWSKQSPVFQLWGPNLDQPPYSLSLRWCQGISVQCHLPYCSRGRNGCWT